VCVFPRCSYLIYLISISRRAVGEWPNRGLYLMYGKLAVDLVRLAVYLMYFMVRSQPAS